MKVNESKLTIPRLSVPNISTPNNNLVLVQCIYKFEVRKGRPEDPRSVNRQERTIK